MQAIILAAGMGKRLKELTKNNTKCMVKVNGVTLIDRMLHQIERLHLSRIVIVEGYKGQKLIDYIGTLNIQTPIIFVNNPIYADALVKIRTERKRFTSELTKIKGVRAIPSQANFVMVELDKDISTKNLLKKLLIHHNILVKELSTKTNGRNYLRLAVRNTEDNNILIAAMKAELEEMKVL